MDGEPRETRDADFAVTGVDIERARMRQDGKSFRIRCLGIDGERRPELAEVVSLVRGLTNDLRPFVSDPGITRSRNPRHAMN